MSERRAVYRKAARKKPVDWEGREQARLFLWLKSEKKRNTPAGELFDDIWHPPNGGHRHKATAVRMKGEGVKAGIPDLILDQARGGWFGLRIEMKATPPKNAPVSESQKEQLARSERRGYCCRVALGWEEARAVLLEYLSWPETVHTRSQYRLVNGQHWEKGFE